MSDEQSTILGNILFVTLWISLFADVILRSIWNRIYFTFGVPIFIMRVFVKARYKGIPFQYLLEDEFKDTWAASFVFKPIDSHSYAFREKLFQPRLFRYIPIMHGLMTFENEKKQVVVKGLANWTTLWLILYFALSSFGVLINFPIDITGPVSFVVIVFSIIYAIQFSIFSKIGRFAAELCSHKNFLSNSGE